VYSLSQPSLQASKHSLAQTSLQLHAQLSPGLQTYTLSGPLAALDAVKAQLRVSLQGANGKSVDC